MARFLKPPDLFKAVPFVHVAVNTTVDLALAEPLTAAGGTQLGVYPYSAHIVEVMPGADQQTVSGDGLVRFQVKGRQQGISMLFARLGGPQGPPWGETQVIVETVLTTTRMPAKIAQRTPWLCWAAATESFMQLQPFGRRPSQDELREEFATWADGALEPGPGPDYPPERTAEALFGTFGFEVTVVTRSNLAARPGVVTDQIRRDRAVILVYNRGAHDSHAVVVYGVRNPPPPYQDTLMVMNPENGARYDEMKLADLARISQIAVAWMN